MKEKNVVLEWTSACDIEEVTGSKFIFTDRKEVRR